MPCEGFHRAIFPLAGPKVALNERHKTVMVIRSKQVQLSELLSNQNVVKMTFPKGTALKDPAGLFNSSLDGNARRAIDIHEGDKVDEAALSVGNG
jgi:hypothetical protein